jgi:putative sigma-54 modulation protein
MRITYTGRQVELAPAQLRKLEARCAKLGKLLDGKDQCEAHVTLSVERHLHRAEISVNYHNHSLVGLAQNADVFTAIHSAILKMEKQAIKVRAKWRDTKRAPKRTGDEAGSAGSAEAASETGDEKKVFRINHHQSRKPMTLDEALLEMEKGRDYMVYRDAETDRLAVLVRRRDGHFDLVEA